LKCLRSNNKLIPDLFQQEKNVQLERERLHQEVSGVVEVCDAETPLTGTPVDPARLKEAIEADRFVTQLEA
jgi:hypothetical protein